MLSNFPGLHSYFVRGGDPGKKKFLKIFRNIIPTVGFYLS